MSRDIETPAVTLQRDVILAHSVRLDNRLVREAIHSYSIVLTEPSAASNPLGFFSALAMLGKAPK